MSHGSAMCSIHFKIAIAHPHAFHKHYNGDVTPLGIDFGWMHQTAFWHTCIFLYEIAIAHPYYVQIHCNGDDTRTALRLWCNLWNGAVLALNEQNVRLCWYFGVWGIVALCSTHNITISQPWHVQIFYNGDDIRFWINFDSDCCWMHEMKRYFRGGPERPKMRQNYGHRMRKFDYFQLTSKAIGHN